METNKFWKCSFDGAYDEGEYLIVSAELYNGVLKLNKQSGKAEYICGFPQVDRNNLWQHHKVYKYKENIVFAPDDIKGLHVYSICDNKMRYIAIDEKDMERARCIDSFMVGNKLWLLFAYSEHPIVVIDLDNWEMEKIDELKVQLPKEIVERTTQLFWSVFMYNENKLYGVVWHSPYIVEIDIKTKEIGIVKLQENECKLISVAYCEGLFWCAEHASTEVTCWNRQGELVDKYTLAENVCMNEKNNLSNLILHDKDIYLVNNKDNCVYRLDKEDRTIKVFVEFPDGFDTYEDIRKNWRRFFSYDVIGDIIRLYPTNANMMLDIDVVQGTIRGYEFVLSDEYDEKWYRQTIIYPQIEETNLDKVWRETKQFSLEDYIGFVEWK